MKQTQFLSREALRSNGYLAVNKRLVAVLGPELSIYISHLADKHAYFEARDMLQEDGSFFVTVEDLIEHTGMTDWAIRKCKDWCESHSILTIVRRGVPAKNYFTIDFDAIWDILRKTKIKTLQNASTRSVDSTDQDMGKRNVSLSNIKLTRTKFSESEEKAAPSPRQVKSSDPVQVIIDHWNSSAEQSGLPRVTKVTAARRSKLAARIREYGLKDVRLAIRAIHRSSFCRGAGDTGWRADIDFLARPDTVAKALEGKYDDRVPSPSRWARGRGRGIISHDKQSGVSMRADCEPVSRKWWAVLTTPSGADVWKGPGGAMVISTKYPEPLHDGVLIPEARKITQKEFDELATWH